MRCVQLVPIYEKLGEQFKACDGFLTDAVAVGAGPSGWLRAVRALTSRLISLAGVKWS